MMKGLEMKATIILMKLHYLKAKSLMYFMFQDIDNVMDVTFAYFEISLFLSFKDNTFWYFFGKSVEEQLHYSSI